MSPPNQPPQPYEASNATKLALKDDHPQYTSTRVLPSKSGGLVNTMKSHPMNYDIIGEQAQWPDEKKGRDEKEEVEKRTVPKLQSNEVEFETPALGGKATISSSPHQLLAHNRPEATPRASNTMNSIAASTTASELDQKPAEPESQTLESLPPPLPPPKDERYLRASNVPSRNASPVSHANSSGRNSEDTDRAEYFPKSSVGEDVVDDSRSEIQSIMEQFEGETGLRAEEILSPRLEMAQPHLESPQSPHPPRRSSLVSLDKPLPTPKESAFEQALQSPPPRTTSLYRVGTNTSLNEVSSPSAHAPQYNQPPPPEPDPEPDLPFDFHRFLEQLRHRTADPVARFLRSFLLEFGKKQWMVHEQVKIIGDFLEFISKKMAQCDVWRTVSDAEFDNAREGMEKLVMNRLYSQTFSPAIPPPEPMSKGRRRTEAPASGRRGQHQEDVERDEVLAQKVRIYKWIREEHLDIKSVGDKGQKFVRLAQQELIKIKSYRAPRDKVICVLNCCKVIFGYLRTSSSDMSADAFVPLLIYVVLQANPDHLVSNVHYILRFRNQDKLGGEAGYYISSLMGAIQFIEGLDKTSLTVSDEEFEQNVEAAVSAIAEPHKSEPTTPDITGHPPQQHLTHPPFIPRHRRMPSPHNFLSEKSTPSHPEITNQNSIEAEQATPRRTKSSRVGKSEGDEPSDENAAVAGLLRTIQRPLNTIGRIFSENETTASSSNTTSNQQTPRLPTRPSSDYPTSTQDDPSNEKPTRRSADVDAHRQRLSAEDSAARQASAEAEEARKIQRQEHKVVVETLVGMFPQLDRDVIDDVVRSKEGRVGLAVDACLALANP